MRRNNSKMRVLHVYKTYFPETQGGLEEVIRQICLGTQRHGVENQVFTLRPAGAVDRIHKDEAKILRYRRDLEIASCGISLSALRAFPGIAHNADVVHYHFPWPFADFMHMARRIRTPSIVTYHSDVVRQKVLMRIYAPVMRRFLSKIDAIAATSLNYVNSSTVLGEYSDKTEVIPIGVNKECYPVVESAVRTELEKNLGSDFFLFVGVLRYYKGLDVLLNAVAGTQMRVVIAGRGPNEEELKKKARDLGLSNVYFLGSVSDAEKVALYDLAYAVVFPSHMRSEAFGVTLVEAAMFGKPLICTEIRTGTTFVNVDGESGIVVPPSDSAALREAMLSLANDHELAQRLGEGAYQRYRRLFTAELMATNYVNLYRRVLG